MSKKVAIAKYDAKGEHFEILVDPDLALEFRLGKPISIDKILISDTVYKDAKKGLRASETALMKVFGTTDVRKIAERILKEGELPLTAEQRRRLIEQKKRQVIEWICRNCIDTRTKTPIPPQRVENALERVGAAIDPFKSVEEQINAILKQLQKVLPIKVAIAEVEVRVPPQYSHKARNVLARMGKVTAERYEGDGTLILKLEIPAGLQDNLISKVNELTHGEGEVKILGVIS
ncbi:MAG: ribosome assembly factor SBDS [Crenarchaeota archaeon]|nr:ribosome assembly factor SBDS [Thermoproteota archaeon]